MKIKVWYYIGDAGDGSAYTRFFSTKKECDKAMKKEEYTLCDDVSRSVVIDTSDETYEVVT